MAGSRARRDDRVNRHATVATLVKEILGHGFSKPPGFTVTGITSLRSKRKGSGP
jgi:hypothetical protein